jgi:hypothetical protein
VLEQGQDDFLQAAEREIRLYLSYAEANVVRTKLARILGDRATVSRLTSITGGWAFTISRGNNEKEHRSISEIAH